MDVESCFQLGYIIKPHGIQGSLLLFLDTDYPEDYENLESVFVEINQKLVPFFIHTIKIREKRAIVQFENVNTIDEAERLKGLPLYLPLEYLSPLEEGQFYYHDVIGFLIVDESGREIGKVVNVLELNGNDLFTVDHHGQEILIPVQDDFIREVDHKARKIHMQLPEGLLELYLK